MSKVVSLPIQVALVIRRFIIRIFDYLKVVNYNQNLRTFFWIAGAIFCDIKAIKATQRSFIFAIRSYLRDVTPRNKALYSTVFSRYADILDFEKMVKIGAKKTYYIIVN